MDWPIGKYFIAAGGLVLLFVGFRVLQNERRKARRRISQVMAPVREKLPEGSLSEERLEKAAGEAFRRHAAAFRGLYESLYLVQGPEQSVPHCLKVLRDWEKVIKNTGETMLINLWEAMVRKNTHGYATLHTDFINPPPGVAAMASGWYQYLTGWGVTRDAAREASASDEVFDRYEVDGENIGDGDLITIVQPAWTLGPVILERGLAQKRGGLIVERLEPMEMDAFDDAAVIPEVHTEGLGGAEGLTLGDVAAHVWENNDLLGPGLKAEWSQLVEGDPRAAFLAAYSAYMLFPGDLAGKLPERYEFLKDKVFNGVEFAGGRLPEGESYIDHDTQGREIEVTSSGTWVVATGERIA